jgi:hypothetical protein
MPVFRRGRERRASHASPETFPSGFLRCGMNHVDVDSVGEEDAIRYRAEVTR